MGIFSNRKETLFKRKIYIDVHERGNGMIKRITIEASVKDIEDNYMDYIVEAKEKLEGVLIGYIGEKDV